MAITVINNRAINITDTSTSGQSWTTTSGFQYVGGADTWKDTVAKVKLDNPKG